MRRERFAYVGLGSNLGDAPAAFAAAAAALRALPGVRVAASSSLYLTEPQGFRRQPFFSNQVLGLGIAADWRAKALLDALLAVERSLGRERPERAALPGAELPGAELPETSPPGTEARAALRFGPRTIDLDLLLFDNEVMTSEELTLPHPRMLRRAFVLVPLAEIAPDLALPRGPRVVEALSRLPYRQCGRVIYQTEEIRSCGNTCL